MTREIDLIFVMPIEEPSPKVRDPWSDIFRTVFVLRGIKKG